jgi:hypothetical protein
MLVLGCPLFDLIGGHPLFLGGGGQLRRLPAVPIAQQLREPSWHLDSPLVQRPIGGKERGWPLTCQPLSLHRPQGDEGPG